ncbi:hypothetical protein C8R43DRAFT_948482 [Mycena crocata]|nr:hypothetical protein C8R43DRAFT_948482 [Mycena crocata]
MNADTVVNYQRSSLDLVIFCRLAERVVTISWATPKGIKILPSGWAHWLLARGAFWECFCGFLSGANEPRSCRIVSVTATGDVMAFCHYESPRCGFKINLSEVYHSTRLTSEYKHIPTLLSNNGPPDMETRLVSFLLKEFPVDEIAPHFFGYVGEQATAYPLSTKQLTGSILPRRRSFPSAASTRRQLASPYYMQRQREVPPSNNRYLEIDDIYLPARQLNTAPARSQPRNTIAGPSRIQLESSASQGPAPFPLTIDNDGLEGKEAKFLRKLIEGQGVAEDSWKGVIEKCSECKRVFTASALKKTH